MQTKSHELDWPIHYFRAVAILAIMATHAYSLWGHATTVRIFFHSSSAFFLFISGYLAQYLDFRRHTGWLKYYRKKLENVIVPFLVFSLLFGIGRPGYGVTMDFWREVLLGRMQVQFWYIPFVTLLFLATPGLCRLSNRTLNWVFGLSAILFFAFPHRPEGFMLAWPDTFHLYAYFTVFYLAGFVYCRFRTVLDPLTRRYWYVTLALATLFTCLVAFPGRSQLLADGYDLFVGLQRFCVIFLVLPALRLLPREIWLLDRLARHSFTLYFVHVGFFFILWPLHDWLVDRLPCPIVLTEFAFFAGATLLLLVAAILVKPRLGRWARPLLG